MPMPSLRSSAVRAPSTHTPGLVISAVADMRAAAPIQSTGSAAVPGAGLALGLYVPRAALAAVLACVQVATRGQVRVIEAQAGRARCKRDATHTARWNIRRAFFGCAIDVGGQKLAVPMQLFRRICVVVDVDDHALAFLETQQRARKL